MNYDEHASNASPTRKTKDVATETSLTLPSNSRSHSSPAATNPLVDAASIGGNRRLVLPEQHCHSTVKPAPDQNKIVRYKLVTVFILCVFFMIAEIVGGIIANSISIQTDAAHLAADIAGFMLSIIAIYLSEKSDDLVYFKNFNSFFF